MTTKAKIYLEMGLRAHVDGDLEAAARYYEGVLLMDPNSVLANGWLGTIEAQRKNFSRARLLLERALSRSNDSDFLLSYANLLQEIREYDRALVFYKKVTKKRCDQVSLSNLAACHNELNQPERALYNADQSVAIDSSYAEAWSNRGVALNALKRHEEALASHDKAIELKPELARVWSNRGVALNALMRHQEALASYKKAIELKPDYAEAWSNRGVVLNDLKRHEEALASYDKAIELEPEFGEAWSNRGVALNDLERHEDAILSFERAIELKPNADYILGELLHTQMKSCDWTSLDERFRLLETRVLAGGLASNPFPVLGHFDDPKLQKRCAELYVERVLGFKNQLAPIVKVAKKNRIRVGYFSMDFREHPVAHLMAEVIESHDRNMFDVHGFSFGINTGDAMRKRFEDAFDKFFEVKHLAMLDIVRCAREENLDIAIDLGGFTRDARPAIFVHRVAPIQVNYLGFPGTMGTPHYDYIIGDRVTVSEGNLEHFSEKVIFLPDCFQANPSQRPVGSKESSRTTYGLPEDGFVFCCFNNVWKFTPSILKRWARILKKVQGSVLWLSIDSVPTRLRLEGALQDLGICRGRLFFSSRVTREIYFDQYRFADLFLDTLPYNAGTTGSDALWMGTPLITQLGNSFAARMGASLLHAVGVPELICKTSEDYERLAIELAHNPDRIDALRSRLLANRATCPLFNTALFTKHIESAYRVAYDRYHECATPYHIYVDSCREDPTPGHSPN